jgi:hypothetical protein
MDDGCVAMLNSYTPPLRDVLQQIAQDALGLLFGLRMSHNAPMVKYWDHLFLLALAHKNLLGNVFSICKE